MGNFTITEYTQETAPHEPVLETASKWFSMPSWEEHRQDPTKSHSSALCGHCDWNHPEVKKVRREKLKRAERILRTGKLPASWMPATPKKLYKGRAPNEITDAECGEVVLPSLHSLGVRSFSRILDDLRLDRRSEDEIRAEYLKCMKGKKPSKKSLYWEEEE